MEHGAISMKERYVPKPPNPEVEVIHIKSDPTPRRPKLLSRFTGRPGKAAMDHSATIGPIHNHGGEDDRQSVASTSHSIPSSTSVLRTGDKMNSITDWLPPAPFEELEFEACPTYVDEECCINLQDIRHSKYTLDVMKNALTFCYGNSKPSPCDRYWFPGQLCIAQFHVDKMWYRGKVLSIRSDNSLNVLFADYGNAEECKASELRKKICMGHIPIQCHKCRTDGIIPNSPDGKWPQEYLELIHHTIVDKTCSVALKEHP